MWHSSSLVQLLVLLFACLRSTHSQSFESLSNGARYIDIDSDSAGASGSGEETVDLYNVCPVLVKFNEEQELLSERELKAKAVDAAMTAYLLSHPNNTLWDFFKIERKQKRAMWNHLPTSEKFKKVFRNVVDIVSDTAIETAHLMADVVEWCVHTLHHPHVGMRQVSDFFNQFGRNVMIIHGLLMNDTQRTVENVGGGTLLFIRHHPADFMSAAIVIFATGAAQIHGLFMAIEFVFGSAATAIIKVLLTVMTFMHFVDVPVLLISPFVSSFAKTSSALSSGLNLTQNGSTLTLDAIQPTNACLIPKAYQPTFSSRDLCLSTPAEVRVLLFGTAKRSIDMSDDERMHAFNYFHDFVCCFLTDQEFEVNAPVINETSFEATLVPMPVKMTDCDKLFAVHSATTAWRTSVGSGSVEED